MAGPSRRNSDIRVRGRLRQAVKATGRSGVRSAAIQIPNTMVNFTAEQNPQDVAQALTEGLSSEAIGNRIISVMLPSQRI